MLTRVKIHYPAVITFLLGLLLSIGLFYFVNQSEKRAVYDEVKGRARSFQEQFRQSIRQHLILLRATDAFYLSSNDVSKEEFDKFAVGLIENHAEIISLQFVTKQKSTHASQPNATYILEKMVTNQGDLSHLGMDLGGMPDLRKYLRQAEVLGAPVMTSQMKAFEEEEDDDEADDVYLIYPLDKEVVSRNAPLADKAFLVMGLDLKVATQEYAALDIFKGLFIRVTANTARGNEIIFSNTDNDFKALYSENLSIMSQNYNFAYGLNRSVLKADLRSFIILFAGFFLTVFLSVNIYTWRKQLLKDDAIKKILNAAIEEKEALYSRVKKTQVELQEREVLLQTILDNMPLAIFAKDARNDYRWLMLNKMAEKMFLLKQGDVVGRSDYDYFPKEEADFFRKTDIDVIAGGRVIEVEAEPVTTAKGTFTAHTIKVPIYEADGAPSMLLCITEDVTEKIKVLEELRVAKEEAEQANVAKSDFLANMSHELRTPLNSILGMNRLLLESDLKPEHRELADSVFRSSVNLLEIVNDILDLSKIESGELELEKIGFDVNYVFYSVVHALQHLAKEKHIKLEKDYDADAFPYVIGDPLRMTQVITNVISNAIKYTHHGSVTFKASCHSTTENRIEIICEISDTGIGIPEDKLERIFEKFGQADTSTTRKYGGTGLGLTITRQLIDMMGGHISVKSELGNGSVFTIRIPFDRTDELSSSSMTRTKRLSIGAIPASEAKILVAEDHPANQILIKKILHKFGIDKFSVVETGTAVLEKFKEEDWTVLLMDCHMPEMNGYDAALAIRDFEADNKRQAMPIVAMTANAMVGEREKCLRCGMNDYISKPIDMDEMKEILAQWVAFEKTEIVQDVIIIDESMPVNFSLMRTFTDGDIQVEKELVEVFVVESEKNMAALKKSRFEGGHDWVEAAHMMKGGAGAIGAFILQALCNEAQHFSGSSEERQELLAKISSEYERVKAYLRKEGFLA